MSFKRIAAVIAALMVAVILCSCAYNPATVMKVGEREITSGEYLYVQYITAVNAMEANEFDTVEDLLNGSVDGVDGRTYLREQTIKSLLETVYVENEYARLKLELDAWTKYSADYYLEYYWSNYYKNVLEKNGVSYKSFHSANIVGYYEELVFATIYGEGGEKAIPTDEVKAYFTDKFVNIDLITFPTVDNKSVALTDEAKAKLGDVAALIESDCAKGLSLKEATLKHYPDAQIAMGYSKVDAIDEADYAEMLGTGIIATTGGDYEDGLITDALSKPYGVHFYINATGGVFVYERRVNYTTDEEFEENRVTVLAAMKNDEFTANVTANAAKLEYTIDEKAVKAYSPDKIVV